MSNKQYRRKYKEDKPVLAICYDFDKTLSPDDMQAQGFIQSTGMGTKEFWDESNQLAEENGMDQNLAYMYLMIKKARGKVLFTRSSLEKYGSEVELFPGVESWFERVRQFGQSHGVIVEHYIISSGLKEMIEGTTIAKNGAFEEIYASSFYFDGDGVALWPAQAINFTNKTQLLFRVEKGVPDLNDPAVNYFFPPDQVRVPFRNMVYIGDSDTDIPCMKLVNSYGGYSIGVYNPETKDKKKVYKMLHDNRIKLFAPAIYSEGGELYQIIQEIILRTEVNEKLEQRHFDQYNEMMTADKESPLSEEEKKKEDYISALESSPSFASTHLTVSKLSQFNHWTPTEIAELCAIAIKNFQVRWILSDLDIADFFAKILKDYSKTDENAQKIREAITPSNP